MGDDLFEAHILVLRALYQAVEVVDICLLMFTVVIVDSSGAYGRLKGFAAVGKLGLFVCHCRCVFVLFIRVTIEFCFCSF